MFLHFKQTAFYKIFPYCISPFTFPSKMGRGFNAAAFTGNNRNRKIVLANRIQRGKFERFG